MTTDTARENSGAIANNFDKDKVQSEINLQVEVTKKFDQNRQEVKAEINKKIDQAKSENQSILDKQEGEIPLSREEEQQLAAYINKAETMNNSPNVSTKIDGRIVVEYNEKSIFNNYLQKTELNFKSIDEQANFLFGSIDGLSFEQAKIILNVGVSRNTSIVIGGSRIRGDNIVTSDIDIGFGTLNVKQAGKDIKKKSEVLSNSLNLENTKIVSGNSTLNIAEIKSPEEFFQHSGISVGKDEKAGLPYFSSGSISIYPNGEIVITPPGKLDN